MGAAIEEGRLRVDGVDAFYRRVAGEGTPTVYCHGNPTHSEDWLPFLQRGGSALAIDMPGWGRSARPSASTTRCTGSPPSSSAAWRSSASRVASSSSTTGAGRR